MYLHFPSFHQTGATQLVAEYPEGEQGHAKLTVTIILQWFNTLRSRQNGRHFADNIFKCIFFNKHVRISIEISLKFVPKGPIKNIAALVQIMAWRQPGNKPLSEPMMVRLLMHICIIRPQ